MTTRCFTALTIALATIIGTLPAQADQKTAASVADGWSRPTFVIPYAWQKPTIDGAVNAPEWQQALSVRALRTTRGMVSIRQATFKLCWDEDFLYVAMQSPMRPGERVIQALRRRDKEDNVVFDDSYEVFIDAGTRTDDGQPCFFQFLANYAGARYDVLHLPAVGNSRIGWSSNWEPINRITSDNVWEWEMAIPRQSLFLDKPFQDGQALTMLLARNFKRPWEQNSVEGTSSFAVVDTHSRCVLSKSAPAVHLQGVADPEGQTFGLSLTAWSKQGGAVKWSVASDSGVHQQGTLNIPAGKTAVGPKALALDKLGDGAFRIRVTSPDDKVTYADWVGLRAFGTRKVEPRLNDPGDNVVLKLDLNPVADYLRVDGDFINYDARDDFHAFQVSVTDAAGNVVAQRPLKIDDRAYVSGILQLPGLKHGDYVARLDCLDAAGKVALTREREFAKKDHAKSFKWWQTKWGNIEKVIDPWTPVQAEGNAVAMWGRRMTIGAAGLPAQIMSQDRALLASPMRLEANLSDGSTAAAAGAQISVESAAAHRVVSSVTSQLSELNITSRITTEFDGMYRVEMTLNPKQPVRLSSLKMVVPLDPSHVDLYHAAGRGIRYGFDYGRIPEGNGRLWDCRQVGSNPMVIGSFTPYAYVGGPDAGLAWFADSDEGWVPNNDVPAFELRRDRSDSLDLVFNLISSDFTIDAPRTIVFAFQATPVKPIHKGWRMDSWWCGDTFKDWQFLGKHGGHQIWTSIPFTLEEEACRKMVKATQSRPNGFIFGELATQRANAVPYQEWKTISARFAPEVAYFGDQWKTAVSDGLAFEETLSDFIVYHAGNWAETCGIDGFYLDNSRPQACDDIHAGRGYRLPDGRIQPTFNIFSVRKLLLRMRAAFHEANGRSKFVLHTTNNFIAPWLGAADVAYDGEHHVIYPQLGTDFMDYWEQARMSLALSSRWGVAVNFMHEYQGQWPYRRMTEVMRAYSGATILYDALPSGNANGLNTPLWTGRARFGIDDDRVEYIGPWRKDTGVVCLQSDVHLAFWKKPGSILIAVVNYGEQTAANVTIDANVLGFASPAQWKVTDAEADTGVRDFRNPRTKQTEIGWQSTDEAPITHDGRGTITVPVKRHSYRQVIVESPVK